MEYVVYVLYSIRYDKIYIGYTSNLIERFKSHNVLGKKGWTIRFRPWQVVNAENYCDHAFAMLWARLINGVKNNIQLNCPLFLLPDIHYFENPAAMFQIQGDGFSGFPVYQQAG